MNTVRQGGCNGVREAKEGRRVGWFEGRREGWCKGKEGVGEGGMV
jgi:hypothetical protein